MDTIDKSKIYYRVNGINNERIFVEIAIEGERWEVECMDDGSVNLLIRTSIKRNK